MITFTSTYWWSSQSFTASSNSNVAICISSFLIHFNFFNINFMKTKIFLPDMTLAIFNGQWVFVCTHAHSLIVALATSLEKTCTVALTQEIVLLKTLKMNMKYLIKVLANSTDKGSSKLCLDFEGRNKIGILFYVLEGGGTLPPPLDGWWQID